MNKPLPDDFFDLLAQQAEQDAPQDQAPSSLKARLYSALIAEQSREAPLRPLPDTAANGRKLCVFEQLVAIAPVGQTAQSVFYCTTCHARVLAEHFDNPPIWWPHCPYVQLKTK